MDTDFAPAPPPGYFRLSRTATYSFLIALPLLVLYEVLILITSGGMAGVRIGAEVWLKGLLASFGVGGHLALGVVVLIVGGVILYAERNRPRPLIPAYFGAMLLESVAYAVFCALLVSVTVGAIFFMQPVALMQAARPDVWTSLALSLGAGLYEELFFRVLLVGGLALLFEKLLGDKKRGYIAAAVLGALVFSAVHYLGTLGDAFTFASFTFRFLFGLALNAIYLLRGFGIAAWTHALYDVMVVTQLL